MPEVAEVLHGAEDGDLYPKTEAEHARLLGWVTDAYLASKQARQSHEDRWRRYYRAYRSYVERKKGDWRSKVFIPMSFWIVEVITPRMVAQVPKMLALPVGPEDVEPAEALEHLLEHSADQSNLLLQLVISIKDALTYGTGILKTMHGRREGYVRRPVPVTQTQQIRSSEPMIDPDTGLPLRSPDGEIVMDESVEDVETPTGETKTERTPYVIYDGPKAEAVDIFDVFVAPESADIEDARYLIHRRLRDEDHIREWVRKKIYRLPEGMSVESLFETDEEEPHLDRLREVDRESGSRTDVTRRPVEILEVWTPSHVVTVGAQKAILRVQENPFDHGEIPFVRIVDHLVPHEFWGIGEIEAIEGLQDAQNAIVNARIDNLRLVLDAMFLVDEGKLGDATDLRTRPGGVIRVKGEGLPLDQVIQRVDLGDVTPAAFEEAAQIEAFAEKTTGVSGYQTGADTQTLNDTATGIAIIQEQGASRFGLKNRLAELTGLRRLARQYGSIIQQFMPPEQALRVAGSGGQFLFETFTPESVRGAIDYDIEVASQTQTETVRREQSMSLLQLLAGHLPPQVDPMTGQPVPHAGVMKALEDVLETFGKKDTGAYLAPEPEEQAQAQQAQAQGLGMLAPGPEGVQPEMVPMAPLVGAGAPQEA